MMPTAVREPVEEYKPNCPDHPLSSVIRARRPGEVRYRWICVRCAKPLGDAGPVLFEREAFSVSKADVGDIK